MVDSLFLQTLHVAKHTGTDFRGSESHADPVAYPCRYQPSTKLVRDKDGIQVVSEAVLYTLANVTVFDRVFPPGADPSDAEQGRTPIRVDRHYDLESGQLAYLAVTI